MSGADFTKQTAKDAIKQAMAGYQNSVNNRPPAGPQLGLLSVDLTTATMPDGTVMPVRVIGSPAGIQGGSQGNTGGYAMVFPDGSGGGLAYWPSPRQQTIEDSGTNGYLLTVLDQETPISVPTQAVGPNGTLNPYTFR